MDTSIQNRTHEIYKGVHLTVAGLYLFAVQTIYEFLVFRIQTENPLITILVNVAFNGVVYFLIYQTVLLWTTISWKNKNKDCCVAGKWYHLHTKPGDPTYVRAGTVTIHQHFNDLQVEAHNFKPVMDETGAVKYDTRTPTMWKYSISRQSDSGEITGCYSASKKFGAQRNNEGLHHLMVFDRDEKGFPVALMGSFADAAPSVSEGNLSLFKAPNGKKSNEMDAEHAQPAAWRDAVMLALTDAAAAAAKEEQANA